MPEVLTHKGFKKFDDLLKSKNNEIIHLKFSNGKSLKCTNDHKLLTINNTFKKSSELHINDILYNSISIIDKKTQQNDEFVYDLLNVEDTHAYYTNDVISHNCVYLDEFGFVDGADEFFTSTFPVISSGSDSKVIITSTPNGMNLFHKLWEDAKLERNDFKAIEVNWWEHPKRDEKWKKSQIRTIGKKRFAQEYGNQFHGSSGTLIEGEKLAALTYEEPIKETEYANIYEDPIENHAYVIIVDISEGVGGDYSVINVFDITEKPYKQVMVWRANTVSPTILPEFIYAIGMKYNEAFVLPETNSIGAETANLLYNEYEYENMVITVKRDGKNEISGGFSKQSEYGIRTTKKTKRSGCSAIKDLIENDVIHITDYNSICEFQTFIKKGTSYEAEDNKNDDIVMTFVIFGWLSNQEFFKELSDVDNRKAILEKQKQMIEEQMVTIGYYDDGISDEVVETRDYDGVITNLY